MGDDIFPDELYHDIITDQQQQARPWLDKRISRQYNLVCIDNLLARVSELADERDSKSCAARRVGSSPTSGTIQEK